MSAIGLGVGLTARASPRAGFDFTAGTLPPGATLSRASAGSRIDAAGVLRIEPIDAPRFDHDPVSLAPRGLLVEPQRTNEAARSAAPSDPAWARNAGVTLSAGMLPAPDGLMVAAAIGDAGDGYCSITQNFGQIAARTLSAFIAKDAVPRTVRFPLLRATGTTSDLALDTATGEWSISGATLAGAVTDHGAFWRVAMRHPACDRLALFPAVGSGKSWGINAATTGSVTVWGLQAEQGATASSYIPTDTAPATRAADVVRLDWARWGIADGPIRLRYVFDDGGAEEADAIVASGTTIVPTTLARPWLKRVERC